MSVHGILAKIKWMSFQDLGCHGKPLSKYPTSDLYEEH